MSTTDGEIARLIQELGTKNDVGKYEKLKLLIKKHNNVSVRDKHQASELLQQGSWEGELEVMVIDHTNDTGEMIHAENVYSLNTPEGVLQIFFLDSMAGNPALSGRVRVWGYKSGGRLLVEKIKKSED